MKNTQCPFCDLRYTQRGLARHIQIKHHDQYPHWYLKVHNIDKNIHIAQLWTGMCLIGILIMCLFILLFESTQFSVYISLIIVELFIFILLLVNLGYLIQKKKKLEQKLYHHDHIQEKPFVRPD
jgi:hypothetical protein